MAGINFNEINSQFSKEITQGLSAKIAEAFSKLNKRVIVLKGKKEYYPRTLELIDKIKAVNAFKSIVSVSCYDDMKYRPYAFFSELLSSKFSYDTLGIDKSNNDFSKIAQI